MKILLILPANHPYRITAPDAPVPKRNLLRFSVLPLLTVAALTPRQHEVALLDENVEHVDPEAWDDVDLVGISIMTATAGRGYELARSFRRRGVRVVAGGYHATMCVKEVADQVDAVVMGDAEGAWPRVVADAEAGRTLQRIYRGSTAPVLEGRVPRRELLAGKAHLYATLNAVQVGRGCRHTCRYCSVTAFHDHRYRARPLEEVVDELRSLPRELIFVDDNIIADPAYARRLFTAMIPLGKRWVGQSSLLLADDPALLDLASQAGCRGLFVGVESGAADSLAALGKSFNAADRIPARIAAIRSRGIAVIAGIIVGTDEDRVTVFRRTLELLERCRIDAVQLNILTPLPGTPLFDDLRTQGRIRDADWSHYDFRHVVFAPARMSQAELQDGADWIYRQFYRLDRILWRCWRSLWTLGPVGAFLALRLNLTYRYDNRREGIRGRDPAVPAPAVAAGPRGASSTTVLIAAGPSR